MSYLNALENFCVVDTLWMVVSVILFYKFHRAPGPEGHRLRRLLLIMMTIVMGTITVAFAQTPYTPFAIIHMLATGVGLFFIVSPLLATKRERPNSSMKLFSQKGGARSESA